MNKIISNGSSIKKVKELKNNNYLNKEYNSFIDSRNKHIKTKNNSNTVNFKTQIKNINFLNENRCLLNKKENQKNEKSMSINQYEYFYNNKLYKNNKKLNKKKLLDKNFYTQDNTNKNSIIDDILLIKNKIHNTNKNKSLSNILKNKKMISSPILDLNIKDNIEMQRIINNNNENDDIDINMKTNKDNIDKDDDKLLNEEIENIKKEILSLQENNKLLLNKIKEEKNKNIILNSIDNTEKENIPNENELNNTLTEISNYLKVNSYDEIIPKLKEMIKYININLLEKNDKNKAKNELITKLQELFISMNNINEKKEQISIKVLWRWIKYLINNYKSLLLENEKKMEIYKNLNEKEKSYKECCIELMNKYKVNNLEELNKFIEELIRRSNLNRKRIEQLKKILVNDNNQNNNAII